MAKKKIDKNKPPEFWLELTDNRWKQVDGSRFKKGDKGWVTNDVRGPSSFEAERRELLGELFSDNEVVGLVVDNSSPAQSISKIIGRVMQKNGLGGGALLDEILDHWEDLIGADIAPYARPVSLKRVALTIEVDNSAMLYDLKYRYGDLLKEKIIKFSQGRVKVIFFNIAGRYREKREKLNS